MEKLQTGYQKILAKLLIKKRWVMGGLVLMGLLGILLFHFIPSELAPSEDMDEVDIYVAAQRDASFQYTDAAMRKIESIVATVSSVQSYLSLSGWAPSKGFQVLNLLPRSKRKLSAMQVVEELTKEVKAISSVDVFVSVPPSPLVWAAGDDGSNIEMEIMSSSDYRELHDIMQRVVVAAKKYPGFVSPRSHLKWDGEEFEIKINREKAADLNVPMQNITNTISTLLAGRTVGHYEYGGKQYDVKVQMIASELANPNVVSQLYVRTDNNKMVPLTDIIRIKEITNPEMLPHFERLRSDTFSASLAPGYTIADAVKVLQKITHEVLPDYAKYSFTGEARNYLESSGKMGLTFFLALIFIYLILVAQFESFIDPFIILLTVPFAMIGALAALKLGGGTLNIYSEIGLVTLIGLIAKHGILITEFANRQRALGLSIEEAVLKACSLRLRPILMTTAAMMLGALPLALASGSGAETRHQIGWVIVGGLLLGTFFSLIVVPIAYTYLARWRRVTVSENFS